MLSPGAVNWKPVGGIWKGKPWLFKGGIIGSFDCEIGFGVGIILIGI